MLLICYPRSELESVGVNNTGVVQYNQLTQVDTIKLLSQSRYSRGERTSGWFLSIWKSFDISLLVSCRDVTPTRIRQGSGQAGVRVRVRVRDISARNARDPAIPKPYWIEIAPFPGLHFRLGTKLILDVWQDERAVTGIVASPGVARYESKDNKKKNEVMKVFIAIKPGKGLVCIF